MSKFKKVEHISFNNNKKADQELIAQLNSVASTRGQSVHQVAREMLLEHLRCGVANHEFNPEYY